MALQAPSVTCVLISHPELLSEHAIPFFPLKDEWLSTQKHKLKILVSAVGFSGGWGERNLII